MNRNRLNDRLRSIVVQAVEAQSEDDMEKVMDLLTDIWNDAQFAIAEAEKFME